MIIPVISVIVARELELAPSNVRNLFRQTLRLHCEQIEVTHEAESLAQAYVRTGVLSRKFIDDALHVALATLAHVDAIASWNFRHLVNAERMRGFNGVNVSHGYGPMIILTPGDIIRSMEEQDEETEQI